MDTRREFIRKAMMLTGAAGVATLPASIQKAMAIDPEVGSSFLDAEHIVLLMQENRSFDHTYGTLRGVRGFNDPMAVRLPNKNAVWLQTNAKGETYSPFRLDIKDTKITWMGSLPHGRESQIPARNNGRYDNWLEAKDPGGDYTNMPLTMGYYTREDIPFYYALADAFTVCDQNFCSSLTGTDPNRCHFWTGTIRSEQNTDARVYTFNGDIENGVHWKTFPERLEENNISWKVYQNEVSIDVGFTDEEDRWLGNFGDNTLEYFEQYNLKYLKSYIDYLPKRIGLLQTDIKNLQTKLQSLQADSKEHKDTAEDLKYKQQWLKTAEDDQKKYTASSFDSLANHHKNIHQKAFVTNTDDPHQRQLIPLNYTDETINREISIPKGDVLYQFRKDVESGDLPTVSWLVAPQNFCDHPDSPWFGAWYLSETIDILTKNPDVWKKTIFILAYDENDGYFDHVPPFVTPEPGKRETGFVSEGIDTSLEQVTMQDDLPGPIGLGYRVPLVIASPWSRGGYVNSQVFDHTSVLQFLELFINKKFNKNIKETNINSWRRAVCGDLSSVFHTYNGGKIEPLPFVKKDPFIESIHKAKFKNVPSNYKSLTADEIELINKTPYNSPYMPQQEKGSRPACALPYELYADGNFNDDKTTFEIILKAGNDIFKDAAVGSPFTIYTRNYLNKDFTSRNYAVKTGDSLKDNWRIKDFSNNNYQLEVYGPNGFYRLFKGNDEDAGLNILLGYETETDDIPTGNVVLQLKNNGNSSLSIDIRDNAYKAPSITKQLNANAQQNVVMDLSKNFGWYDLSITVNGNSMFEKRYAGHLETGKESKSDPVMSGT